MFLKNSIERILHEPAIKKSANAELKKACETALGKIYNYSCLDFRKIINEQLININNLFSRV